MNQDQQLRTEIARLMPILERLEDSPLWAEFSAGTGVATLNGLRAALTATQQAAPEYMHPITILTEEVKPTHWEPQQAAPSRDDEVHILKTSVPARVTVIKNKVFSGPVILRVEEASAQREQSADDVHDAETELNCAEEVLDAISVDLDMEQTAFDCIGDYITAVVEAVKKQSAGSNPEPQAQAGGHTAIERLIKWHTAMANEPNRNEAKRLKHRETAITLQAMREAIAKKDAALKACVEALENSSADFANDVRAHYDAITQGQEALK